MKEKEENSYNEDFSIKELNVSNTHVENYRQILYSKEYVKIHINKSDSDYIYINMNISSYIKINKMLKSYPEENVCFLFNKNELYTPRESIGFSQGSIISKKDEDCSFSSIKIQSSNKKSVKEEIINTDIVKSNTYDFSKLNKLLPLNNEENIDNIKIENEIMENNIKNTKLFSPNFNNDNNRPLLKNKINIKTSADKKLVLFKWLYHYYLILSILIFLHYITFIFSDYNYVLFYKWIAIALIISLAYVGYIGIKYKDEKAPLFIFNERYLFWIHFLILILTIFSFSALLTVGGHFKFVSSQGFLGYLICFIYLISLIIEGIYSLYYDVIIDEINWDKNKNKINEYTDNKLNIQLTELD